MFEKEAKDWVKENMDCVKDGTYFSAEEKSIAKSAFEDGAEFGYSRANEWHKLDWKQDYPKLNRLVRVRTQSGEEYICETYAYQPTEDEIGYGTILTQFEQLNGDLVDDNEIEYWCYIEPFKEEEIWN